MSILPANATELEINLERLAARISSLGVDLKHNKNPNAINVNLLDLLALEFSVDYWNASWNEAKKRAKILTSIEAHRYKGTVWAVKQALKTIDANARIIEQTADLTLPFLLDENAIIGNNQEPNTARVITTVRDSADIAEAVAVVNATKPLHVAVSVQINQALSDGLGLVAAALVRTRYVIAGVAV